MKRSGKATRKRSSKRELFAELSEGMNALADARHGQRTLTIHFMESKRSLKTAAQPGVIN